MATSGVESAYNNQSIFLDNQSHGKTGRSKEEDDALGKNAFLTMMVAQLKNQDPMNPLDGTDFTAQLAQFSGLEQQVNMNDNLKSLLAVNRATNEDDNIFDYIGKEVVSNGNPVSLNAGSMVSGGHYTLKDPATVSIMVYNPEGVLVKEINSGTDLISQGRQTVAWDGTDDEGNRLADGKYSYKIIARTVTGDYTSASTTERGLVEGVTREGGRSYLLVNGQKVAPGSVATVVAPEEVKPKAASAVPAGNLPPELMAQLFGSQGGLSQAAPSVGTQPSAALAASGQK